MELERDHALDRDVSADEGDLYNPEDAMMQAAEREDKASDALTGEFSYQALGSRAAFDRVLYDGADYGGYAEPETDEELDFIGLPGLLEPEQVHELLMHRQARQAKRAAARPAPPTEEPTSPAKPLPLYRTLKEQRSLLNSLVGLYAKTSSQPHGLIHAELRRVCGGPPVAKASMTQLEARIQWLRKRLGHA
jgi:hypothetical protein